MQEKINLTNEQFEKYTNSIRKIQTLTYDIGQINLSFIQLQKLKLQIIQQYNQQTENLKIQNGMLQNKYGIGIIDLQTRSYILNKKDE